MLHDIFARPLLDQPRENEQEIILGAGCFWGVERRLWQLAGVTNTAVGYAGGHTFNPTYKDVCSGTTNHVEVVKVTYLNSPQILTNILISFWEMHDPTQGMRQGNDVGTQYRSVIFYQNESQLGALNDSLKKYQNVLTQRGLQTITTTIEPAPTFFLAEDYHQQYLYKNPNGYCGLAGTGCSFPQ